MDAFKKKLALLDSRIQKGDLEMFPNLHNCLTSADVNRKELLCIITLHLKELAENFDRCFPPHEDPRIRNLRINNPFTEDVHSCNRNSCEKECLIELCCDTTLLSEYKMQPLAQF